MQPALLGLFVLHQNAGRYPIRELACVAGRVNPLGPFTGGRAASPASVVPGRLHSSRSRVICCLVVSPVFLSSKRLVTLVAMISSLKRPASWAAKVRCWLLYEYSSCASREIL